VTIFFTAPELVNPSGAYSAASGATVFAQRVTDPSRYGVVELDSLGKPLKLQEKPETPGSDLAVTGLYFFDHTAFARAKTIKPSVRGELEITDLNQSYLDSKALNVVSLPRGTAWLDTGTIESLAEASEFVKVVESRQGFRIACPEEIAWRYGYLDDQQLENLASSYGSGGYSRYLLSLLEK